MRLNPPRSGITDTCGDPVRFHLVAHGHFRPFGRFFPIIENFDLLEFIKRLVEFSRRALEANFTIHY
jgi:hypothetical protein